MSFSGLESLRVSWGSILRWGTRWSFPYKNQNESLTLSSLVGKLKFHVWLEFLPPRHLYKNLSFANFWYLSFSLELATECLRINSSIYRTLKDAAQQPGRIFPINLWLSSSSFCANNDKDTSKGNIFYNNGVKFFFDLNTYFSPDFPQFFFNFSTIHVDLKVLPEV